MLKTRRPLKKAQMRGGEEGRCPRRTLRTLRAAATEPTKQMGLFQRPASAGADTKAAAERTVEPMRNQAGFTLLEVLVAMAILAVAITTMLQLSAQDRKSTR